jgi:hypothetical protein
MYIFTAHEKPIWIVSDTRRRSDLKWFKENYGTAVKTVRVLADDDVRRQRGWVFTTGNKYVVRVLVIIILYTYCAVFKGKFNLHGSLKVHKLLSVSVYSSLWLMVFPL